MDFTLKIFYTVAALKSFSKASESLFLTQPTISFHIKKIENEFETQLFERKNNTIYLTEAGQILYDYAEQVFFEYERIKIKIGEVYTDFSGTLTVGVASLISQYLFSDILSSYKKICPNTNVIMLIGDSHDLIIKLQQKEIDLAIVSEPVSLKNYNVLHFFNDEIVPIVNNNHEWADEKKIMVDDLFKKPLVSREEGSGSKKIFEKFLRQNKLDPRLLNISFSLGSAEAVKAAVINGMGYGVISKIAIQDELSRQTLKIVNVNQMKMNRNFLILFSPEKKENKRFKMFLDFIACCKTI